MTLSDDDGLMRWLSNIGNFVSEINDFSGQNSPNSNLVHFET